MRLVIISDTYEQHAGVVVPDGDVFIHAGDFTYHGGLEASEAFGTWLARLPHRQKLVIAGNHDFVFEHVPASARTALGSSENEVQYSHDPASRSAAFRFGGAPWQTWFMDWI